MEYVGDWHLWVSPALYILGGLLAGLLTQSAILSASRRFLNGESWLSHEQVARLLGSTVLALFVLWGIHLASFNIPYVREGVLTSLRKVLFIGGMMLSMRLIANFLLALITRLTNRFSKNPEKARKLPHTSIFENLVRFVVFIIGLMMILQTLGVSITPLLTALGVGGLAVSLALKDTLENFFAGIQMILAQQIKLGDMVQLENGQTGQVEDIAWRTTILKQLNGNRVILPNSKLAQSIILNYTTPHPDLTIGVTFAVPLDSDLDRVEAIATEVGMAVGRKLLGDKKQPDFIPQVRYQSYGESWVNVAVNLPFKKNQDAAIVKHELIKALHARLREEGISMPFPQRVLHIVPDQTANNTSNVTQIPSPLAGEGQGGG